MKSYREFSESVEGDELYLFIVNHAQLYRQRLQPIHKNAVTKMARDQYDSKKAVKLFMYAVDEGAKLYSKEFSTGAAKITNNLSVSAPYLSISFFGSTVLPFDLDILDPSFKTIPWVINDLNGSLEFSIP